MRVAKCQCICVSALCVALSTVVAAQTPSPATDQKTDQNQAAAPAAPAPAAPAAPAALPTPSITGPLSGLPPATFDAGPFGKIAVNGILGGLGMWTGNYVPGDNSTQAAHAFHPKEEWYSPEVLGIDLGIMLLMAENTRSLGVWEMIMSTPEA